MEKSWKPEPQLLESLDAGVPEILASQRPDGQFGRQRRSRGMCVLMRAHARILRESARAARDREGFPSDFAGIPLAVARCSCSPIAFGGSG